VRTFEDTQDGVVAAAVGTLMNYTMTVRGLICHLEGNFAAERAALCAGATVADVFVQMGPQGRVRY